MAGGSVQEAYTVPEFTSARWPGRTLFSLFREHIALIDTECFN